MYGNLTAWDGAEPRAVQIIDPLLGVGLWVTGVMRWERGFRAVARTAATWPEVTWSRWLTAFSVRKPAGRS